MSIIKALKRFWKFLKDDGGAFQSIGAIVIPIAVFWAGALIQKAETQRTEQLEVTQQQQADDAQVQAAVVSYFNQLSTIVGQGDPASNPKLRSFLTASTLMLLRDPLMQDNQKPTCPIKQTANQQINFNTSNQPDPSSRKEIVIKHLIDAKLVQSTEPFPVPAINLERLGFIESEEELGSESKKDIGLDYLCLAGADLTGARLARTSLKNTNLERANLTKADLRSANLDHADLRGARLIEAQLNELNDLGCGFTSSPLPLTFIYPSAVPSSPLPSLRPTGVPLSVVPDTSPPTPPSPPNPAEQDNSYGYGCRQSFVGASLQGAKLQWADLQWANLQWANLTEADLAGANLTGTNLAGANLTGTNLAGANLTGANLTRADFRQALNLSPEQIKTAKSWEQGLYSSDFHQQLGLPQQH